MLTKEWVTIYGNYILNKCTLYHFSNNFSKETTTTPPPTLKTIPF